MNKRCNRTTNLEGTLTIARNDPERFFMEDIGQAFERVYPRVAVEVDWHSNAKPLGLVKSGKADIGITVKEEVGFQTVIIA